MKYICIKECVCNIITKYGKIHIIKVGDIFIHNGYQYHMVGVDEAECFYQLLKNDVRYYVFEDDMVNFIKLSLINFNYF